MKLFFAGVRGCWPRNSPAFARYGGDTTCLLVRPRTGSPVFLDAGTGITEAAERIPRGQALLLLTHAHLDHLQGLPSLNIGWPSSADCRLTIAGPECVPACKAVRRLLTDPLWPLEASALDRAVDFRTLSTTRGDDPFTWGSLVIRFLAVPHPGSCVAYRLDECGGGSFVFAPDLEWGAWDEGGRAGFARLCETPNPANLLVMDGQFSEAEIVGKRGWGHSSIGECAVAAKAGGVGRLLITHHAPSHDDPAMDALQIELGHLFPEAAAARQGQEFEI